MKRTGVFLAGPLPPPMEGPATVLQAIFLQLRYSVNTKVLNFSVNRKKGPFYHLFRLKALLLACLFIIGGVRRYRIIHITVFANWGLLYNIVLGYIARILNYKIILHHHSMSYVVKHNKLMDLLVRITGKEATHVVLCDVMDKKICALYPMIDKRFLFPTGCLEKPRVDCGRDLKETITLGFLSNLIIEKGVDSAIDLARKAIALNLPVRLIMAGKSVNSSSNDLVIYAQNELGKNFEYWGAVDEQEKEKFFQQVDVFIFPSRYQNEVQPRVVSEALARAIPVFTTDIGGLSEMVDGRTGLCVPQEEDFTSAAIIQLKSWTDSPKQYHDASLAALDAANGWYDRGMGLQRLIDLIRDVRPTDYTNSA